MHEPHQKLSVGKKEKIGGRMNESGVFIPVVRQKYHRWGLAGRAGVKYCPPYPGAISFSHAMREDMTERHDNVFSDPGMGQPWKPLRIRSTNWGCSVQNSKMKAYGPSNRSLGGVEPLKYSRRDQYFNIAYILRILWFVVGLRPYPFPIVGPDSTFRCPVACI